LGVIATRNKDKATNSYQIWVRIQRIDFKTLFLQMLGTREDPVADGPHPQWMKVSSGVLCGALVRFGPGSLYFWDLVFGFGTEHKTRGSSDI
jgi:hypothetical protein